MDTIAFNSSEIYVLKRLMEHFLEECSEDAKKNPLFVDLNEKLGALEKTFLEQNE